MQYWGEYGPGESPQKQKLRTRQECGQNYVYCAETNLAMMWTCYQLIEYLENTWDMTDMYVNAVKWLPGTTAACTAAWTGISMSIHIPKIAVAARKTWNICSLVGTKPSGMISSYATHVWLGGACAVQCLSKAEKCFGWE